MSVEYSTSRYLWQGFVIWVRGMYTYLDPSRHIYCIVYWHEPTVTYTRYGGQQYGPAEHYDLSWQGYWLSECGLIYLLFSLIRVISTCG